MSCPDRQALLESLLHPREGDPVRAHLESGCRACTEIAGQLQSLGDVLSELPLEPASEDVVRFAKGLARPRRQAVRELLASFVPAPTGGAAPALRSSSPSTFPRLYRTEDYEVDVIRLDGGALVGQVLPLSDAAPELTQARVLLDAGGDVLDAPLSEEGEFRFESVPPGACTLVIDAAEVRIRVPDVELGES